MIVVFPGVSPTISATDQDFIVSALGSTTTKSGLMTMLNDPESVDIILEDDRLYQAIVEHTVSTMPSARLQNYLLARHALKRVGLDDKELADYLAALLSSLECLREHKDFEADDVFNPKSILRIVRSLNGASLEGRFLILSYLGNYTLLISGLFPELLTDTGNDSLSPDLKYCEKLGRASFRAAAEHRLSWEFMVSSQYDKLSTNFREIRIALNDLAEQGIFDTIFAPDLAVEKFQPSRH